LQAFELTHRLDAIREREDAAQKEIEALKDQLSRITAEKDQLLTYLKEVRSSCLNALSTFCV
jgi:predicted  nucleic acid-binding Zn-ribbon protein